MRRHPALRPSRLQVGYECGPVRVVHEQRDIMHVFGCRSHQRAYCTTAAFPGTSRKSVSGYRFHGIIDSVKENQVICGQWRLVREIGHGAYGTVYLAERRDGERAAVKVCRRDAIGEERYERELRGAKLYSAIPPQEGLVHMRELVGESWGFYAVMDLADDEFGDGRAAPAEYRPKTLARVIEGEKALPLGECVKLGIALAKGLAALQRYHLLHRDIKPGNVIYVGGRPVLSDPGLVVEEFEAASLVGTPGYVPPENFTTAAGDVYSLGLTLKAASFGRSVEDLDKGPALEADTGAKLFPAWWRILNKAIDPTPSRRYQSAKALLKDIERLRRKMVVASVVGSRVAKVAIAGAVICIVAVVASLVIGNRRAKSEIAKQAAEIAKQAAEIAKQAEKEKQDASNARFVALLREASIWREASMAFVASDNCSHLSNTLRHTKVVTSNTNLVALVESAQTKLYEVRKKSEENGKRYKELKKVATEKSAKGLDITKETMAVQKLMAEEGVLKKRVEEIARSVYGEKWKPPAWLWHF